jgi:hypothetical protein
VRTSTASLLFCVLLLGACGKEAGYGDPKTPSSPAASPGAPPPATTKPDDAQPARWTGTLEKMGPSIVMQGTHRLVDAGKTVVILQSAKVDLSKYEGKRVSVTGKSAPTVEGNQTIVDVSEVTELP